MEAMFKDLERRVAAGSYSQDLMEKWQRQMRYRLQIRRKQTAFHPNATQFTLPGLDQRVLGLWRQSLDRQQSIFALHNVSAETIKIPSNALNLIADLTWTDLLSGDLIGQGDIMLAPYQCRWISNIGH